MLNYVLKVRHSLIAGLYIDSYVEGGGVVWLLQKLL
jgi:transcriptional regulator CtsR